MATYAIRTYGDPVLRRRAKDVVRTDGSLAALVEDMFETLDTSTSGIGLAATQIGVQKRLFVYDIDDDPQVVINPVISEARGEWTYEEGCLSVPGLSWPIVRPKEVHLTGFDLDGNEVSVDADELLARLFQHEVDHLDGILLIEHLDADQRREAMRILSARVLDEGTDPDGLRTLLGPDGRSPIERATPDVEDDGLRHL